MTDDSDLSGKRAIVTGASAGIGRSTARLLAEEGAAVAVAARREHRLNELADEFGPSDDGEILVVPTDVTDTDQIDALVAETVDAFGGLDIVVSNAGLLPPNGIDDLTEDQYRNFMGVNVDGMYFLTKASLPHLREGEGNLVFVGSYAGTLPFPRSPLYAGSKWWLRGFAHSLQGAEGMEGVAVSVVNPGEVRTEIGEAARGETNIDRYDPGEITEPREAAEAIVFTARQHPPNTVTELNLMRRTKFDNLRHRSEFPD
ncbi:MULTISPECIES: SDR family oxidoreductase [Salinibaculum]|uniref:SDR family oxidoreductase n=1 Tax=Salinibaculum TaxID=2732368 RepID=UPI0030CCFE39